MVKLIQDHLQFRLSFTARLYLSLRFNCQDCVKKNTVPYYKKYFVNKKRVVIIMIKIIRKNKKIKRRRSEKREGIKKKKARHIEKYRTTQFGKRARRRHDCAAKLALTSPRRDFVMSRERIFQASETYVIVRVLFLIRPGLVVKDLNW